MQDRGIYALSRNQSKRYLQAAHGNSQQLQHWALVAAERISAQTAGQGAAIVRHVQARGIGFLVATTWPGTRALERQLKNRKHASRFCPVCQQTTTRR
jgi:hypothetical protein